MHQEPTNETRAAAAHRMGAAPRAPCAAHLRRVEGSQVNFDYHVEVDYHYDSVSFSLVHEQVEARATATTIEIFDDVQRYRAAERAPAVDADTPLGGL